MTLMLTTITTLLLTLIPVQNGPLDCPGIADPAERLACYDAAFSEADRGPDAPQSYRRGQWLVAFSVDAETDDDVVNLVVAASETATSEATRPPRLQFRCAGGTLNAWIDWAASVGNGGDEALVNVHIDAQRAYAAEWEVSADGTATFPPQGAEDAFLNSLLFAERLIVRVAVDDASPLAATFNVSGLRDTAPPLWAECPPR